MAIFSLRHTWLGKSHKDYKPGVGKAHANYVTRQSSCTKVFGARAPTDRQTLKAWLNNEEVSDRKNARIIDKLMVALPIELTAGQRAALVRDFCERVTEGRASWVAAVHDRGEDAHNPHVHIILRDRDVDTGRRVMMTTERGSTERFRQAWEETANDALRDAGLSIRIDRRSLAEQGVEREAAKHAGPKMPISKDRSVPATPTLEQPANGKQRERLPEDGKPAKRSVSHTETPDWTHRGGMVAQQWSATQWLKKSDEVRAAAETTKNGQSGTDGRRARFVVELSEEQKTELEKNTPEMGRGGLSR
jgi:hypothetical protein